MLAGTGAVECEKDQQGFVWTSHARLVQRVTGMRCEYVLCEESSNVTTTKGSYDGQQSRRMKWLGMFNWKREMEMT